MSASLLADIKNYLDITWDDTATDNKVRTLAENGMAYLNNKCGYAADYEVSGYPRTLLFEFVRYSRDSALDVFEANYLSLIIAMQNEVNEDAEESTVQT